MRLELHLTLLSDSTFGRGDGVAGLIDSEVEHDKYGMPYLRGRVLKGLLVEECANLLYSIQHALPSALAPFESAAFFLFGRAGSSLEDDAQMRVGNVKLPDDLRTAIIAAAEINEKIERGEAVGTSEKLQSLSPEQVLSSLTTIRRQTAVDDETSAPEENSLRSLRVSLRGTRFVSQLRFVNEPIADVNTIKGLLAACIMALRRGGTSRNRGRGKVEARLLERNGSGLKEDVTEKYFKLFEDSLRPKVETVASNDEVVAENSNLNSEEETSAQSEEESVASISRKPRIITYRARLLEPALVTELDGDPNSAVAFDYLPGSVIRGALIAKFQNRYHSQDLALDTTGRRLFFDGAARFLNAYPMANEKRSLPMPFSFQYEKNKEEEICDFSVRIPEDAPNDKKQWKRVAKPFCLLNGDLVVIEPERHLAIHTSRTRRYGRAMTAAAIDESKGDTRGAVYRIESLAAEQEFAGAILCEKDISDEELNLLQDFLGEEATLGGSRTGGYGRAEFSDVKLRRANLKELEIAFQEDDDEDTEDLEKTEEINVGMEDSNGESKDESRTDAPTSRKLKVTLLSDVLLRDKTGQISCSAEAVADALQKHLGGKLTPEQSFASVRVASGFNRKWGLPLAQEQAILMGSVFVFDTKGCDFSKLSSLEWIGIGERRVEGFGRIAFDLHKQDNFEQSEFKKELNPVVNSLVGSESEDIAKLMADRLLRLRLDELVIQQALRLELRNPPSNSQIGRIRNVIHKKLMSNPASPQGVRDFVGQISKRAAARKQFEKARIGDKNLLEWLEKKLDAHGNAATIKSLLNLKDEDIKQVGGISADFASLNDEYLLRYVDAVLSRAAKLRKENR